MATTTGKKEYSIKINGVTQSVADVTKLEKALNSLDAAAAKQINTSAKTTAAAKQQKTALTDEEKAEAKLAATKAKIAQADSELNKQQIAATQALRERTREVARAVAQDKLETDSIAAMGMQLTDLRNAYEQLSAAERNDLEVGGKMLEQIQSLDSEYKALRESTGNFRDSVGDYKKALQGLGDLKDGLDKVGNGSTNLAASIVGSNEVLDSFGEATDAVSSSAEGLQGVIALGSQAQEIYNAVVKEGVIQEKAAAVMDGIRTIQAKAAAAAIALEGEATVGATIAQAAFNIVAALNPYVLLAIALIAVIGALVAFATSTDKAAESQKELNAIVAAELDLLDQAQAKQKEAADARVTQLQNEIDILNARGAKTALIRDAEDKLARERAANNARLRGFYGQELDDLDANRKKVDQLREVLAKLNIEKAKGEDKVKLDIDLDGKIDKVKVDEAIESVQGQLDNLGRKVQVAVDIKTDTIAIQNEARVLAATRSKEDKERRKADAAAELSDLRALQDDRAMILAQSYDNQRAALKTANNREIQDLQVRLKTDEHLTKESRALINANIVTLGKVLNKQLADLNKEQRAAELDSARATIDSRNALIIGGEDRQRVELETQYQRQINDLKRKLETDKTLTVTQQADLSEQILNAQTKRDRDLATLAAAGLEQRASTELANLDETLAEQREKITKFTGDVQVKSKTGLQLIDVKATRANLAATNAALADYISGLTKYQGDLDKAHAATLATLQQGTPEYQAELDKYAKATSDNTDKIKKAQNEQTENTRASNNAQIDYYRDAASKITALAQETVSIFQQGTQLFADSVAGQLDALNAQLDAVNEKYDAAKDIQDKAVQAVQDTEAQLQEASGGTADALREQLADQMRARNEAAREEQRIAKQKDKLEQDIQKKEKQQKRIELISNIAGAVANTAQGATQALATYPPPFSYVAAAITTGLGLAQVAIMAKQLTKLGKGGPIVGKSHSEGGERLGDQYEVEGGEFVVNKQAMSNNAQLVRFINESSGVVTPEDLVGLTPGSSDMIFSDAARSSNADVIEAIDGIDMRPVVSVVDINTVNQQLTEVQDLAGFNG